MKINDLSNLAINKFDLYSQNAGSLKMSNAFSSLLPKSEFTNFAMESAKYFFDDIRRSLSKTELLSSNVLMNKKGNIVELVTALSETEAKLKILINVRDSAVSALQEIMRMQI